MPQIFPYYLAISQAFVPLVIQIADLTGPLGVSALLLALQRRLLRRLGRARAEKPIRAAARRHRRRHSRRRSRLRRRAHPSGRRARAAAPKLKIGVVQANVGIKEKWDPRAFARLLGDAPERLGRARAQRRRAHRLARVVVPVLLRRRDPFAHDFGPKTTRAACSAASRRRCCSARSPRGTRATQILPVQLGAAARRRRRRDAARSTRSSSWCSASTFRSTTQIQWFTKRVPGGVELQPRHRRQRLPAQDRRASTTARPADLLRGHFSRVRAPGHQARPQRVHQHHQRRLVRPHRRAVRAPGARRLPLGRAPPRDGARGQHRRLRVRRRGRARAAPRRNPSIRTSCRRRRRRRCWSTWRCSRGGLYRHVGDVFGLGCLAALVVILIRSRRRAA